MLSLLTSIKTKPALRNLGLEVVGLGWALLGQASSTNKVDWEVDFDTLLLCFSEDFINDLVASFVEKRLSDIDVVHLFEESEGHATTNDHLVDLGKHVPDELDFISHLGSSQNDTEGSLGALEGLGEVLQLLLHKEASGSDLVVDTNHRGMSSMGCSEGVVHEDLSQRGQLLSEFSHLGLISLHLLAVLDTLALFFDVVPQIFKQNHLAVC